MFVPKQPCCFLFSSVKRAVMLLRFLSGKLKSSFKSHRCIIDMLGLVTVNVLFSNRVIDKMVIALFT